MPSAYPTPTKYADFAAPDPLAFTKTPDYQFRLSEGQRALEHSAAARGSYFTPNTMRGLTDYAQNTASGEYDNAYGRALQTYGVNRDTAHQYFDDQMGATGAANAQANTDREFSNIDRQFSLMSKKPAGGYAASVYAPEPVEPWVDPNAAQNAAQVAYTKWATQNAQDRARAGFQLGRSPLRYAQGA